MQIKPHFLFNALSAIANLCSQDAREAESLILDLSVFLREELKEGDRVTTLETELEITQAYFHIEQARYGQKIQYITQIETDLNQLIPAFTIQPLVENAIRHGLAKKIEGGTVTLTITEHEDGVSVTVTDTGVGIDEEKLGCMLNGTSSETGLPSIHSRLLEYSGRGLTLKSELHQGTEISFWIGEIYA